MSSNAKAYILLAIAIVCGAGPVIVNILTQDGFPHAAHAVSQFVAIVAAVWLAWSKAIEGKKTTVVPPVACLAMLLAGLSGCLSSAPIVPVTAANQAQIASCQGTAALHNDIVLGDFVFAGAGTALSGVGALVSDSTSKNDAAIGAAVSRARSSGEA